MRLEARVKMGYYPTPPSVVDRIKTFIEADGRIAIIDPCCGEGLALERLACGFEAETYGIELDEHRAEEARTRLDHVLKCGIEETRITHGCFSCLFLNPPYDWEAEDEDNPSERKEKIFLKDTLRYLRHRGLLIYIIPQRQLTKSIAKIIAYRFEDILIYRFPDEEFKAFKQIVVFGSKKEEPVMNEETYEKLLSVPLSELREFPFEEKPIYKLPISEDVKLFKSMKVDTEILKKEVKNSPLWKKFKELTRVDQSKVERPPLPLHTGHLGLLLANGLLDGVVGEGKERHLVRGKVEKIITRYEELKDKYTEERELESFKVSIKILKQDGEIVTLM